MRRFGFCLGFLCLLCSMVFANGYDDGEQIQLEGVWRVTGMMKAGQIQPFGSDTNYSFKKGALEIHAPPQPDGRMAYHAISGVRPRRLVMRWDSSVDAERSDMIYGFDAGHLWICYAPPGQSRPTTIATDIKNNWTLIVFERQFNPEQLQLASPRGGSQNNRPLEKSFQWLWGTGGHIDQSISKKFAIEAEFQGRPAGRMWAAFCRRFGVNGFGKDVEVGKSVATELVPMLIGSSKAGNLNAHFLLGLAAETGLVGESKRPLAFKLYSKAALLGHSPSMLSLAYSYKQKKDWEKARYWFAHAALFGNALAMNEYALCYYDGLGGTKDTEQAIAWCERALVIGDFNAANNLGVFTNELKNYVKSVEYYQQAADKGIVQAMYNLGIQYEEGNGVDRDLNEARRWTALAAKHGHRQAEIDLRTMGNRFSSNAYSNYYTDFGGSSQDAEAAARRAATRAVRNFRQQRNGW